MSNALLQITGEQLVAAVRANGSDATTPRDAAHEAAHAIHCSTLTPWTRDNVHESVMEKYPRARAISEELSARAIEMLVCGIIGEPYDLEEWAFLAFMETTNTVGLSPKPPEICARVRELQSNPAVIARASDVLELARMREQAKGQETCLQHE